MTTATQQFRQLTGSHWSLSTTPSTTAGCPRSGSPTDSTLMAQWSPSQARVYARTTLAVDTGAKCSLAPMTRKLKSSVAIGTEPWSTLSSQESIFSSMLRTLVSSPSALSKPTLSASTPTLRSATTSSSTSCLLKSCPSLTLSKEPESRKWPWLHAHSKTGLPSTKLASCQKSCVTSAAP